MIAPCTTTTKRIAAIWLASALFARLAIADTNTAKIVADTVGAGLTCMEWKPAGVCFWLNCGFFGCNVRASVKIFHYSPDLVVSTYHSVQLHPWADWGKSLAASTYPAANTLLAGLTDSAGTRTRADGRDRNHPYRDADAFGHPVASLGGLGLTCPIAAVSAFRPYFQSQLDALVWRQILPTELLFPPSVLPGLREIGHWPLNTWGNLYPRDGRITQASEPKAAAVIASRVGDIVTRRAQPHVYSPVSLGITNRRGQRIWLPPPLLQADANSGKWQMLDPQVDRGCYAFGANDSVLPLSWSDGRGALAGGAVFNLWRPYRCCRIRGAFIASIDWF